MLESLGKSLSKIIDERLSNPLVVSFIFAWCGWNYKFIVLLFSKTPAIQTFDLIKKVSFPNWYDYGLNGFLYPLATTLLYIYGLPLVSRHVNDYWRKKQLDDRMNRQVYEDQRLLTVEESREIKMRNQELETTNEKLTDERDESTRNAKEAFRAKADAETLLKGAQEEAKLAVDRYNVMKDSLEAVREERNRVATEIEGLRATRSEMRALRNLLNDVSPLIPSFGELKQGMRARGEGQDGLILWYLKSQNAIEEPFTLAMLETLTVVEAKGPLVRSGIVEFAKRLVPKEVALRLLQNLFDRGYIALAGRSGPENEPVYVTTDRGKGVVEARVSYNRLLSGESAG